MLCHGMMLEKGLQVGETEARCRILGKEGIKSKRGGGIYGIAYIKPTATSITLSCSAKSANPSHIILAPLTTTSPPWDRSS